MFFKTSLFLLFSSSIFSTEHVYLKTPNISHQNIIGTNVGIRPYRKAGIRLETETLQDKFIVHNYGYGGSGLTLSFGGSKEVLTLLEHQKNPSKTVAVLGAGVVGLTTAYDLLEKGYEVHIYSEKWNPDLTSNVAAGSWTPYFSFDDITLEKTQLHQQLLENAKQRFLKSTGEDPEFAGVKILSYYIIKDPSSFTQISPQEEVIIHFDNGAIRNARRVDRIGLDGKLFMQDLHSKVLSRGAIFQQKRFENLEDILNLSEPIIVNCMSMGSREVFNDQEFIPIRGQLVYFKFQEEIDYMLFQNFPNSDYFFHIYPWSDRLILGGVYEQNEEEFSTKPEVLDRILQNAMHCLSKDLN